MVAMAVLALTLTAVLQLQGQTASMAGYTKFETAAPLLAQKKMSEFMALDADELTSDRGDFGEEYPEFAWYATVDPVPIPENMGETAERLRRVDMVVSWRDGVYTYELRAYRLLNTGD